jgi:imidazolonepropionase-like amidohydrolase
VFDHQLFLVGAMHRAGVRLMAGTGAILYPFCFPGFSLHDELELLVEAGLTPLEALQCATRNPAEYLGEPDRGVIAAGAAADLVLLDADPLEEIGNVRRIDSVVTGGIHIPRGGLDAMLREVRSLVSAS